MRILLPVILSSVTQTRRVPIAYYPNAAFGAPKHGVVPRLTGAGDKIAPVLPWTATTNVEYSRDISAL